MTVAELIDKLKKFDPDLPVETEGCDCVDFAKDAELGYKGKSVVITRI